MPVEHKSTRFYNRERIRPFGKRFESYNFQDMADGKTDYVYCGEWYHPDMLKKQITRQKAIYCLLTLFSVLTYLLSGLIRVQSNGAGFIALVNCLQFLMYIWLFYILYQKLRAKENLTIWQYRVTSLQLILSCELFALLRGLATIFTCVCIGENSEDTIGISLLCAAAYLVGCLTFCAIIFLERRTPYRTIYPE